MENLFGLGKIEPKTKDIFVTIHTKSLSCRNMYNCNILLLLSSEWLLVLWTLLSLALNMQIIKMLPSCQALRIVSQELFSVSGQSVRKFLYSNLFFSEIIWLSFLLVAVVFIFLVSFSSLIHISPLHVLWNLLTLFCVSNLYTWNF